MLLTLKEQMGGRLPTLNNVELLNKEVFPEESRDCTEEAKNPLDCAFKYENKEYYDIQKKISKL